MKLSDFHPTDDELALINEREIGLDTIQKDDVVVLKILAADSNVDRGNDQFQPEALKRMAELAIANKIPMFLSYFGEPKDHDHKSVSARATCFDAFVENGDLIYKMVFPLSEFNIDFLNEVIHGVHNKVSVGFLISPDQYLCSICNEPIVSRDCPHEPGEGGCFCKIMDVVDNLELSFAGIPMQPRAHILGKEFVKMSEEIKAVEQEIIVKSEEIAFLATEAPVIEIEKVLEVAEAPTVEEAPAKDIEENLINDKIIIDSTATETQKMDTEDLSGVRHAECLNALKELCNKCDALHNKVDALHTKVDALTSPPEKEESKSLDERASFEINSHKSLDELLWERLNSK